MKMIPVLCFASIAMIFSGAAWSQTPALPEPGLLIYGPIVNRTTQQPVSASAVTWQISGGGDAVTLNARIVNINGRVFHVTRVPFETRVVGTANFTRTPGTLELKAGTISYSRIATVDGLAGTVLSSSRNTLASFPFGMADRGLVEQVTLGADIMPNGDVDSDGDGETDAQEAIAGTNPNDPNSVFHLTPTFSINPQGGLVIHWPSVAGRHYTVLRSISLANVFTVLAADIVATPPQNTFSDTAPAVSPVVFYRIAVAN